MSRGCRLIETLLCELGPSKQAHSSAKQPKPVAATGCVSSRSDPGIAAGSRNEAEGAHHFHQCRRLRQRGVPLLGYLHWSLFDNYEWGTYTPRFGLYSIEYDAGVERRAEDHLGDRPSETYARLISESRTAESAERELAGVEP